MAVAHDVANISDLSVGCDMYASVTNGTKKSVANIVTRPQNTADIRPILPL